MKNYLITKLIILCSVLLVGCASVPLRHPHIQTDLTQETWMNTLDRNPGAWTRGADHWFFTGEPNATEYMANHAPVTAAISTMHVKVPDFKKIVVDGDFQVQIIGVTEPNSVDLYGPNSGIRQISVKVNEDSLYITQVPPYEGNVNNVIVRIGINHLHQLTQKGAGTVEGVGLRSNNLIVTSEGDGNVYLAGRINARAVTNYGCGAINIFDTQSPWVDIYSYGSGVINMSGSVGIKKITHQGSGNVNIIGAKTRALKIYTDGSGKIGIVGDVALQEINACGATDVYIDGVNSRGVNVTADEEACIGLSGRAHILSLTGMGKSTFYGRSLCVDEAYVKTFQHAHANIAALHKALITAQGFSSVYFFGDPQDLTSFNKGYGTVIPIPSVLSYCCAPPLLKGEG